MPHDRLEERIHVAAAVGRVLRGEALQGGRVNHRKVELRFGRAQTVEEIEGLVEHPVRARFGPVDLVDDDDRPQAVRKRLLRDEARLRHRSVDGVDEQQHGVDHRQHALDLAAEVGVAWGVDDVDAEVAPADRGVLGEDRDPALAFDRIRVHHPVDQRLARIEGAGLTQQLVHQCGLAVIDVRNDRNVAQLMRRIEAHGTTGR